MNSCLWIILLLACGGNFGNNSCQNRRNRGRNSCASCGGMHVHCEECGCANAHHDHENCGCANAHHDHEECGCVNAHHGHENCGCANAHLGHENCGCTNAHLGHENCGCGNAHHDHEECGCMNEHHSNDGTENNHNNCNYEASPYFMDTNECSCRDNNNSDRREY